MIGSYVLEESLAVSNPPRNSMRDFFCGDPDKWLSAILEHCSTEGASSPPFGSVLGHPVVGQL